MLGERAAFDQDCIFPALPSSRDSSVVIPLWEVVFKSEKPLFARQSFSSIHSKVSSLGKENPFELLACLSI